MSLVPGRHHSVTVGGIIQESLGGIIPLQTGGFVGIGRRLHDHKSITIKELCNLYLAELKAGLILGKGGHPKKALATLTDTGRIERHIIPLLGVPRVKDLSKAEVYRLMKDIIADKSRIT